MRFSQNSFFPLQKAVELWWVWSIGLTLWIAQPQRQVSLG